jgi:hypothetical protein
VVYVLYVPFGSVLVEITTVYCSPPTSFHAVKTNFLPTSSAVILNMRSVATHAPLPCYNTKMSTVLANRNVKPINTFQTISHFCSLALLCAADVFTQCITFINILIFSLFTKWLTHWLTYKQTFITQNFILNNFRYFLYTLHTQIPILSLPLVSLLTSHCHMPLYIYMYVQDVYARGIQQYVFIFLYLKDLWHLFFQHCTE